jgi:hypothetical protein
MGSVDVKVEGFWSSNPITLYIHRYCNVWTVRVSNSSGGRDTEEVESDMVAYKNYAAALTAMCDLGAEIQKEFPKMEAAYQMQREEYRQEREAKMAAEQAMIDADVPMGESRAMKLMEEMAQTGSYANVYRRGSEQPYLVECVRREKTKYYFGGSVIAKRDLIAKLAGMSTRSGIAAKLIAA